MPWPISLYQGPLSLRDVDAGDLPEIELGGMRAGLVAARDEGGALGLDRLERGDDVLGALDAGRIALRPDQDEVVVHHRIALHAEAFGDELLFLRLGMHEHHVGIAAAAGVERLAGALRHHLHVDAGLRLEQRQDVAEQAGVLGRGGRGDDDRFVLRERAARRSEAGGARSRAAMSMYGVSSMFEFSLLVVRPAIRRRGTLRPRRSAACRRMTRRRRVSTTRPRCSSTISPASRRASPRSCVDITTLMPRAATARMMSSIALVAAGSRLAVGSSRNSTSGSRASARASASRCCSPPDSRRAGAVAETDRARPARAVRRCGARVRRAECRRRQRIADIGGGAAAEHHRALEHDGAARGGDIFAAAPGDAPARRRDQPHRDAQQRGLAGAVRPDQHRRRARRERERDAVEDRRRRRTRP